MTRPLLHPYTLAPKQEDTGKIIGKGAVITGGASGLGLATARALEEAGAKIGVIDLEWPGGWSGAFAAADVGDIAQVETAFASLRGEIGSVYVAVNCAGGGGSGLCVGPGATLTPETFARALAVNTLGRCQSNRNLSPAGRTSPNPAGV